MRGLADLRRRLDDEASAIFTQRASKDRRFYQALGRFEDARRAIHDSELRAGDWKALNERIDSQSARLKEIKASRGVKAAQRARLSRNRRVAPLVHLIDRDRNRLAELGLMPEAPIGFSKVLRERLEAVRRSNETRARIAGDEATASRDHAEIVADDAVLARAADVQRLFGETGAYASNLGDLPSVRAEADEFQGLLAEFAARLGVHETELSTMLRTDGGPSPTRGPPCQAARGELPCRGWTKQGAGRRAHSLALLRPGRGFWTRPQARPVVGAKLSRG
jgi:AAA domain